MERHRLALPELPGFLLPDRLVAHDLRLRFFFYQVRIRGKHATERGQTLKLNYVTGAV